jgi:hypothetical protein
VSARCARTYSDDADGADGVPGIPPAPALPRQFVRELRLRFGGRVLPESPLPSHGDYAALVAGELAVREARPGDARAIAELSVASWRWS